MTDWKHKKIIVLGLARTGIAVAETLSELGANVYLTEYKKETEFQKEKEALEKKGVKVELGGHSLGWLENAEMIVVSPGVSLEIPYLLEAKKRGVKITSELELAWMFSLAPIIAITGTNGKTTTTSLMGEIMKTTNKQVVVGGNIGLPLVNEVGRLSAEDVVVAEVSSFQLETTQDFCPKVSAILNITEDHLDRHKTLGNYTAVKSKIFANQGPKDFVILNADDPLVAPLGEKSCAQVIFFSREKKLPAGVYVEKEKIISKWQGWEEEICLVKDIKIKGSHNLENALAAIAMSLAYGIQKEDLIRTLRTFDGVEHRLEFVREKDGVKFYNDSKGTNPDAAIKALEAFSEPVILIAGGRDKGVSYRDFATLIREKAKTVILLGEAAEKIQEAVIVTGFTNIHKVNNMEEAVQESFQLAQRGDVVLLSPACASFDMFKNYEVRGEVFKQAVRDLG